MDEADQLYSSYIANCAFNAFSSYTAIMLNIVTIHAMRKTSSLPNQLKTLLLSLAVSDLGVGLLVQPLYIALMLNPTDQSIVTTYDVFTLIFVHASLLSVVAISTDRFLAIHLHLRYQELVTHKRVVAVVVSIWVLSIFSSLYFWRGSKEIANAVIAVVFGLCLICTTVVYCRIYLAVRLHTNHMQALQVQQVAQNSEMANAERRRKSAVSTFYVYLVFLVCCLPQYFVNVARLSVSEPNIALHGLWLYTVSLVFVNSSLNPVIYCWKMKHVRHAIMDILRNIFPSQNGT
ncbi:adenosine receptor A3-like [Oculina patagonica]